MHNSIGPIFTSVPLIISQLEMKTKIIANFNTETIDPYQQQISSPDDLPKPPLVYRAIHSYIDSIALQEDIPLTNPVQESYNHSDATRLNSAYQAPMTMIYSEERFSLS